MLILKNVKLLKLFVWKEFLRLEKKEAARRQLLS